MSSETHFTICQYTFRLLQFAILSNSLCGLSRGASKMKRRSVEGFNWNGKVYHCNCDCERAAIQNRENRIQNTEYKKDWWQLRFVSSPNERNSKYRQSITKFRSVTLDVAFTLSQVYHCASVLWTACVKSCSLSCAKICTKEVFAASASYFFLSLSVCEVTANVNRNRKVWVKNPPKNAYLVNLT